MKKTLLITYIILYIILCHAKAEACSEQVFKMHAESLLLSRVASLVDSKHYIKIYMKPDAIGYKTCSDFSIKTLKSNGFILSFVANNTMHRLYGKWGLMVAVPVIKRNLQKNEQISTKDIDTVLIKDSNIKHTTILQTENLIGKSAKHSIKSYQQIEATDVWIPKLIKKGNTITVIYRSNNLEIKTTAIAKESGELGKLINAQNPKSKKIFPVVVKDINTGYIP